MPFFVYPRKVMKSILRQTLEGARFLHERGILHRDLKPPNLIVSLAPTSTTPTDANADSDPAEDTSESSPTSASPVKAAWGRSRAGGRRRKGSGDSKSEQRSSSSKGSSPVLLRIADFSSAVDQEAIAAGLYGATGPVQDGEETLQYAPPEVLFDPEVGVHFEFEGPIYMSRCFYTALPYTRQVLTACARVPRRSPLRDFTRLVDLKLGFF